MAREIVKDKVGDMEEEIKERFSRRLGEDMTGLVKEVVGKRSYLVRLQDVLEKDIL